MGRATRILRIPSDRRRVELPLPTGLTRRKPRVYQEWKALKDWGKLPAWNSEPPGYLLRELRENADLTQTTMSERLDCSQQAIAQAERWGANPTAKFMQLWAAAVGQDLEFRFRRRKPRDSVLLIEPK
ncbi:MAG: helix-turn-helix transcriptional regulator [Thermoanaerobaculia bacterium]